MFNNYSYKDRQMIYIIIFFNLFLVGLPVQFLCSCLNTATPTLLANLWYKKSTYNLPKIKNSTLTNFLTISKIFILALFEESDLSRSIYVELNELDAIGGISQII